jgi:hypothetical protein
MRTGSSEALGRRTMHCVEVAQWKTQCGTATPDCHIHSSSTSLDIYSMAPVTFYHPPRSSYACMPYRQIARTQTPTKAMQLLKKRRGSRKSVMAGNIAGPPPHPSPHV